MMFSSDGTQFILDFPHRRDHDRDFEGPDSSAKRKRFQPANAGESWARERFGQDL
jgi:hypothetical protein